MRRGFLRAAPSETGGDKMFVVEGVIGRAG